MHNHNYMRILTHYIVLVNYAHLYVVIIPNNFTCNLLAKVGAAGQHSATSFARLLFR
mgnify:CR=1 FL=1